ncbi:hypothetical protein [Pulveribacter suum]|uniref:Uncharacterized protein n=1 Tax=Pulveribacter suum TaxID=2116657 RepID=A0A2P1NHR1_9BURK|nr:hypothetical protein [Pulveribacter suum]AVP56582.1 hypothetical protein C7H73_02075 [Pulveribacter suum]
MTPTTAPLNAPATGQPLVVPVYDVAARRGNSGRGGLRGASSLVLAAVAAALMVVAAQMVESWTDGHLLAAWMVLWLVAFASLALLAAPARRAVVLLRQGAREWSAARRRALDDERTWNAALHDARLMADLSRAMNGIAVEDLRRYRF